MSSLICLAQDGITIFPLESNGTPLFFKISEKVIYFKLIYKAFKPASRSVSMKEDQDVNDSIRDNK